jgi:hypothetical protein
MDVQSSELITFPIELLHHIFSFLPAQNIVNLQIVSSKWRYIVDQPKIWKYLLLRDFGVLSKEQHSNAEWKTLYMNQNKIDRAYRKGDCSIVSIEASVHVMNNILDFSNNSIVFPVGENIKVLQNLKGGSEASVCVFIMLNCTFLLL